MLKEPPKSALDAAQQLRRYVHFDTPLSNSDCITLVADPNAVCRHAFYPFLRVDFIRTKFQRIAPGQVKRSKKIREIRYASHADAAIYAYYNFVLMKHYEQKLAQSGLTNNVTAFRSLGRSNIDFAQEAFEWIDQHRPCVALGFDVKDFFGSIDHTTLKNSWANLLGVHSLPRDHYAVFKSLAKHASVELRAALEALNISKSSLERATRICDPKQFRALIRGKNLVYVNKSNKGIPQGSPISAALSNIYMLNFDIKLKAYTESCGGLYRRYCDDILLVIPEMEVAVASALVESALLELHLDIQHAKTLRCCFGTGKADRPLQYLGLIYDGEQVSLRAAGVSRFFVKMRRGVRQYKNAKRTDGDTPLLVQRRKELLNRYSRHAGKKERTYFKYVNRAALKSKSTPIPMQLRRHRIRLKSLMGS